MNTPLLLALASALLGCICLYGASPHQRWRASPWPQRPCRTAGGLLLLISLIGFLLAMQATAAVFAFVTCVMLMLSGLSYVGALLGLTRCSVREG